MLRDLVIDKLDQYGIEIVNNYEINKDYAITTEEMNIFVNDDEKSVSISFYATTVPENVARYVLIIYEIDEIEDIYVMDSYIFDNKNNMIIGEQAHTIANESLGTMAVTDFLRQQTYIETLKKAKCYTC